MSNAQIETNDTTEEIEISPIDLLNEYIRNVSETTPEIPHAHLLAAVKKIVSDYGLEDADAVMLLCSVFTPEVDLDKLKAQSENDVNQVQKYAFLFHRYVKKPKQQRKILAFLTAQMKQNKKKIHFLSPLLLQFYNEYLLDSAVVKEWAEKKQEKTSALAAKLYTATQPFLEYTSRVEAQA